MAITLRIRPTAESPPSRKLLAMMFVVIESTSESSNSMVTAGFGTAPSPRASRW